jgi:hypothetical protein
MSWIVGVALCLVAVAADATVAAGHRASSAVAVAVAVVTVVERSLEAAEVETEVEADFVVVVVAVLRPRSWSSSMASTHSSDLASVLAERQQPVAVGTIGVVDDVIQVATCRRRYRALEVCIGSIEPHTQFEDGALVELKVHKLGSLLVVGQIEVVMSFDLREFGIVVAVSRLDREVVTVVGQGLGSTGRA